MSRMIDEALETMRDLEKVGVVSKQTMRDFEAQALLPPTYTADAIRRLRENLHVSQAVFAAYLNASVSTVQKWETGDKKPNGAALRLLSVRGFLWLPFLRTYRTICLAPKPEFGRLLDPARDMQLAAWRPDPVAIATAPIARSKTHRRPDRRSRAPPHGRFAAPEFAVQMAAR